MVKLFIEVTAYVCNRRQGEVFSYSGYLSVNFLFYLLFVVRKSIRARYFFFLILKFRVTKSKFRLSNSKFRP